MNRFVPLDTTEEALRLTCKEAFGIGTSEGITHKRELGKAEPGKMQKYTQKPK